MRLEAKKYLLDISTAAEHIASFTRGRNLASYTADPLLRYAAVVDDRLVWGVVEGKLPELKARVESLLDSAA